MAFDVIDQYSTLLKITIKSNKEQIRVLKI